MSPLRVGLATVDFTPEVGLPLMGNFRDDYAARGVHDPLLAKAVVLEDPQGTKAVVLAIDVCMLDRDNVAFIRGVIADRSGVPPQNVFVHATHTHSAPAPSNRFLFGLDFEPYCGAAEAFLTEAASAVVLAEERLAPAELSIGYSRQEGLSFNRRLRRRDGTTQMNWEALASGFNPDEVEGACGPVDPEVICLVVERDGRPEAAIVNFGLHPAILAGDNWLYSADFPGQLAEALSRTVGAHFSCLFLNGCCGNVNHVDYREPRQGRGYQMTQRVGYVLGAAAHQAIGARAPVQADRVAVSSQKVTLDRIQISEDERSRCEAIMVAAANAPPKGQVDGLPDAFFADLRLDMYRKQDTPDHVELMTLRIGDVAVVGLPGESFCETGMEIKRRSTAAHTLVAGLSNDAVGYLPTRESFPQGGYETTVGSTVYQPGTAERLVEAALEQIKSAQQGVRS